MDFSNNKCIHCCYLTPGRHLTNDVLACPLTGNTSIPIYITFVKYTMLVMQPVSLPCMWGTTDPLVCWCLEQLMNMWIVQPCVSFWHTCVLCVSQPSQCSAYCIGVRCPIGTPLLLVRPAPMKQWSWRVSCMGRFVMQPGHNLWWCVWHTSDTLKWHLGMSCHLQGVSCMTMTH